MPSFDVVCTLDLQEVDNAIHQTVQELGRRFDFRDVKGKAVVEILKERLAKRNVPLKAHEEKDITPGPVGTAKQDIVLQDGIPTDKAKEAVKLIKESKLKVQASIQGEQ